MQAQATASTQACRRIHSPRGAIRPVDSASGTNWSGPIRPLVGCRHRTKLNAAKHSPSHPTTRLVMKPKFLRASMASCATLLSAVRTNGNFEKLTPENRQPFLVRWTWRPAASARSARFSSPRGQSGTGAKTTPMLTPSSPDCREIKARLGNAVDDPKARRNRRLVLIGRALTTMANSSPPNRASTSVSRTVDRNASRPQPAAGRRPDAQRIVDGLESTSRSDHHDRECNCRSVSRACSLLRVRTNSAACKPCCQRVVPRQVDDLASVRRRSVISSSLKLSDGFTAIGCRVTRMKCPSENRRPGTTAVILR